MATKHDITCKRHTLVAAMRLSSLHQDNQMLSFALEVLISNLHTATVAVIKNIRRSCALDSAVS